MIAVFVSGITLGAFCDSRPERGGFVGGLVGIIALAPVVYLVGINTRRRLLLRYLESEDFSLLPLNREVRAFLDPFRQHDDHALLTGDAKLKEEHLPNAPLRSVFGAALGFLIFAVALGGWMYLFTGRSTKPWNGLVALIICSAIGGCWGLLSYKFRNREFGSGESSLFHDEATALLFMKRLMVIVTCLAGLYFVWQLAKGL